MWYELAPQFLWSHLMIVLVCWFRQPSLSSDGTYFHLRNPKGSLGFAGCGFLDTVTVLIKLGADVNARDLTQCTPLQNAAHGTYSALATMPLNGSQGGVLLLQLHATLFACLLL